METVMKTTIPEGARAPTVLEATISLVALVIGITTLILIFGLDPHITMVLGVIVASIIGLRCGFPRPKAKTEWCAASPMRSRL